MVKKKPLEEMVENLVGLEEGPWPEAKDVATRRRNLREMVCDTLLSGKRLPENSPYEARLKEVKGRISYKGIVGTLMKSGNDYTADELREEIERLIGDYQDQRGHRLTYGRK